MLNDQDTLNWKLYVRKKRQMTEYGIKSGYIKKFDDILIKNLRNYYYGGIPLSILLLSRDFCDGNCYESSFLLTFGLEEYEFKLVVARINDIKLNPVYIEQFRDKDDSYDYHCFVEVVMPDKSAFVYDTSVGLIYEKNFYYSMQEPEIISISDKNKIFSYSEYNNIKNSNIVKNDFVINLLLPSLEKIIYNGDDIYNDALIRELEIFKDKLNNIVYDNDNINKKKLVCR